MTRGGQLATIEIVGGIKDHYTMVPNEIFRDPEVTPAAAKVYGFLRSHTSGYRTNVRGIATQMKLGKNTVNNALQVLEKIGYVKREWATDSKGLRNGITYKVFDSRCPQNGDTGVPNSGNPDLGNPKTGTHKEEHSFKKNKLKEDQPPIVPQGDERDPFDEWWEHYPKKVGKGQARTAFRRALRKVDLDTLTEGARQLAAHHQQAGTDKKFIPNPSTWLNGERWDDELLPVDGERTPSVDEVLSWDVTPSMNEDQEVPF